MRKFSATELAKYTSDVLAVAAQSAVEILCLGKSRFVILPTDQFHELLARGNNHMSIHVDDMTDAQADILIAELTVRIEDS